MQHNIKNLLGYKMSGTDGEIGKVTDFYFDDAAWTIRYLIVETGDWLAGRKVLISPQALLLPDWDKNLFPINLTVEQIKNSPDIDTDKPVSRQQEIDMYGYYSWERYGGGGFYAGGTAPLINLPLITDEKVSSHANEEKHANDDHHLRSTEDVTGYHIHAVDGDIGHVNDFIVDEKTWQLLYFIVDTHNWFGGKKVLIPVGDIKEVEWENSKVIINITKEAVKESRLFDETSFTFPQNLFEL